MTPITIEQAIQIAFGHHQAGRLAEAEGIYRQVLAQIPDHPDALHLLGVLAHQTAHTTAAIELIGRAIAIDPTTAEYHSNLGEAYRSSGQREAALASFRRAVELQPDLAEAHNSLGLVLNDLGRPGEAIAAYERAIALRPGLAEAHNNLGNARWAEGRLDEAIAAYEQAIALHPGLSEAQLNLGIALKDAGRLVEAVAACTRAIELKPDRAEAYINLGSALCAQGRLDEAIAACNRAITLKPAHAEAHNNLGNTLCALGRLDEAIAACTRAIELNPAHVEAHNNLGNALCTKGRLDEAIEAYNRAIELKPDHAESHINLGNALRVGGRLDEAVAACNRAIALRPGLAEAHISLGNALLVNGQPDEAIAAFSRGIELRPNLAEAHINLGNALLHARRFDEAIAACNRAIELEPDLAEAHNNLGNALKDKGFRDEAIAAYQRAIELRPSYPGVLTNLGNAYKDQGFLGEAVACYRAALTLRPDDPLVHSNLLFALHYQSGADPAEILVESRRYAERHAAPLTGLGTSWPVQTLEGHRLRVGYVCAEFREHAMAYFLEPILATHDHRRFEIFCYTDVAHADATTRRFQGYADHWRPLVGLSDAQAATLIRRDGIDLLIDLSGHKGFNRLRVFARKPAPVQATYLGYLGTTGLSAIDYYITDGHTDPPGLTEAHFQEKLVRLPECGMCYLPGVAPDVPEEPPAQKTGHVTFASLNTLAKLSGEVLDLWLRLLAAVPGARLLLRTGAGRAAEERMRAAASRHGVAPERVVLLGPTTSRFDYLKLYHEADLALDPFPYNGVTTTCDALWMGVPVLTLAGRMSVSRQGVRFLSNVGLDPLIASSTEAYLHLATELAKDLDRLTSLRCGLRERMSRSPLMDSARFTHHLESAYLSMWERWVAGH